MSASPGNIYLRAGAAEDQATIRRMILDEGLNPTYINWVNFLVAEEVTEAPAGGRRIVGIGQIKPYKDGGRELASIAVLPAYRSRGVAALIIQTLLAQERGPVYLMCGNTMPAYYRRFGFVEVDAAALPYTMRRLFCASRAAMRIMALLGVHHTLYAMRHAMHYGSP